MVVFDSEFLKITYDEKLNAILEEWKLYFGPKVELDTFRKPLLALIDIFKEKKLSKWLSDNTEQTRLNEQDQFWLEDEFYPAIVSAGLNHVALVNAKNILGTSIAKNCLSNLSKDLEIEIFNKSQPAQKWLAEV
jgi:hypothetical protein